MTDKDCINPAAQLKNWHVGLIQYFRKECAKLPKEKQKPILAQYDYSPPCQIVVFWLSRPNWQLTITTHFEDRGDLEVAVHGPYASNIFLDEAEKVLRQPEWDRPISKNSENLNPNHPSRYGERVAQLLHGFVEVAKNSMFADHDPTGIFFRQVSSENEAIETFCGDKRFLDYEKLVQDAITGVMNQPESGRKPRPTPKKQAEPPKHGKGFGAYFLPPIIIGKLSELTISDRLHGTTGWLVPSLDRKSFIKPFGETPVIITDGGYVGACTGERELAIRILNTIMATFEMNGLEARAVREHELSKIEYDPETMNITSVTYDTDMARNIPFDGYVQETTPERAVRGIKEETAKNIVDAASKTFEDRDTTQAVVGFGDMLAHLRNSEFPEAFIIGWKIIESHIVKKWKDLPGSRVEYAPKNPKRHLMAGEMLEALKPTIPKRDYDTFMALKDVRNRHMHGNEQITRQQAQNMIDAVKNHVLKTSR